MDGLVKWTRIYEFREAGQKGRILLPIEKTRPASGDGHWTTINEDRGVIVGDMRDWWLATTLGLGWFGRTWGCVARMRWRVCVAICLKEHHKPSFFVFVGGPLPVISCSPRLLAARGSPPPAQSTTDNMDTSSGSRAPTQAQASSSTAISSLPNEAE